MGDIDILIQAADREKSHVIVQQLGFRTISGSGNVWHYAKGSVHLEIHTELLPNNINNKFDYMGYFANAWNKTIVQPNGYTYTFTPEYHLLYMLVHIAKHFYGYGCGIRMIMDVAAYIIHYGDKLDWDYVTQEIEKLNLATFASNIFNLCRQWFEVNPPDLNSGLTDKTAVNDSSLKEIEMYILSAGTFGFYERNTYTAMLRKFYASSNGVEKPSLVKLYKNYFFPSYAVLSVISKYAFVNNRPYLLPVAWVYRIARGVIARGGSSIRILKHLVGSKKDYGHQADIITKMGL